jgi:hypothetical protein
MEGSILPQKHFTSSCPSVTRLYNLISGHRTRATPPDCVALSCRCLGTIRFICFIITDKTRTRRGVRWKVSVFFCFLAADKARDKGIHK